MNRTLRKDCKKMVWKWVLGVDVDASLMMKGRSMFPSDGRGTRHQQMSKGGGGNKRNNKISSGGGGAKVAPTSSIMVPELDFFNDEADGASAAGGHGGGGVVNPSVVGLRDVHPSVVGGGDLPHHVDAMMMGHHPD
jgi:hypothetical protein